MPVPIAQTGCVHSSVRARGEREGTDLVGDHDELPVSGVDDDFGRGGELAGDDFDRLIRLALLEVLADAEDHVDADLEGGLGLRANSES